MHTGQVIYAGRKGSIFKRLHINFLANLSIGNVMPVQQMPEGTVVSNLEGKIGDCGQFCRASGTYAIIIGHT